ncbi:hypothetical protein [Daejeonella oryzae]|uniref:hypothetical protein n=1 Tax=Daejeonella oryzae TaxID=1122943 RepID=UPI000415F33F|nr:hypothetical protein [Daejeonella oryzae]
MKTKLLIKACLLFILLTGCGKDGGGAAGLFFPNFSNLWSSSRGTLFQFLPTATNVSKGDFTGDEDGNTFTGSFNNLDIQFTFSSGAENGVKYTGQFVKDSDPLTMKVKGTNNVELTIVKN